MTDRVTFVHGTFGTSYVARFEAYYLFNPFGENLFGPQSQIDGDVELSEERYARDIVAVEKMLHQAPPGIFLITYNGFGGKVPDSFTQVRVNREFPNVLQMWQKTSVRGVRRTQAGDSEFPHHFPS